MAQKTEIEQDVRDFAAQAYALACRNPHNAQLIPYRCGDGIDWYVTTMPVYDADWREQSGFGDPVQYDGLRYDGSDADRAAFLGLFSARRTGLA